MTLVLSILQALLALHTGMGAFWKLSHPARNVPGLDAIPPVLWRGMAGAEFLLAIGLVLPLVVKSWQSLAATAAIGIALEMLLFCVLHLRSEATQPSHLIYWLVVVAVCVVIAYGRLAANRSI